MARVDTTRLEGILAASKVAPVVTTEPVVDDTYYTKVLASGKTQAQIDALRGAYDTAAAINERVTSISPVTGSTVDRTTGKVTTTYKDPNMIQMLNGILYKGGIPFNGDQGDTRYVNGQPTETYDREAGKWVPYTGGTTASSSTTSSVSGLKTDAQIAADAAKAQAQGERQSAYDLLYSQFKLYGLESLVEPLKGLIITGASPAEFTIRLRESEPYKKRFSANADRIKKGLKAISEAEYLELEDQYQNVMRNYGLPESYYARGDMGMQEGFNKFIANDVSALELEDRISTAQKRVLNANPEVLQAIKDFYGDSITNGDILAYTLNPTKGLEDIKRKVTAAEIGGAAIQSGLRTGMARAEELGAAGITKQQAQQGFGTIAGGLERGSQLASIYGENPYTQTTAEKEVFGLAGQTEAAKERKKLTSLEKATFGGQTGVTSGALARDRAGAY
jgi:hypothetical protein